MKKDIIIIHPHSNLLYNVTLNYLVSRLIDFNVKLVIFTNCSLSRSYYKDYKNVEIHNIPIVYPQAPRRPWLYFYKTILPLLNGKLKLLKTNNPEIICIDPEGLHIGNRMYPRLSKHFNFISFEMFFLDELKDKKFIKLHKKTIRIIQNGIKSLLIPDKYRLRLFLNENKINSLNDTFFIPVAPSRETTSSIDSNFKSLELDLNKKSVIYSGSLYDWSGVKELITSTKLWSADFSLFIHSHRINPETRAELEKLILDQNSATPITLLEYPYNYDDYLKFLKQFDIGLATYIPFTSDSPYDGKNFGEIGYSSSKFSTLMMLGKPTITTTNQSYLDLKKEYDFGYVIKDYSEIAQALNYINDNYENNKTYALKVYEEILKPDQKMTEYINYLVK